MLKGREGNRREGKEETGEMFKEGRRRGKRKRRKGVARCSRKEKEERTRGKRKGRRRGEKRKGREEGGSSLFFNNLFNST